MLISDVVVARHGDTRWRLDEPMIYRGTRDTFTVPQGYVTDFATVPRIVAWLIPRYGRYTPAAILHDYLITDVLPAGEIEPNDVDGLFRRVMRELGVSTARRWLMWAGVRWGSLFSGRTAGWIQTAPAVLGISAAALPVLLLGVPGVALALLLFELVDRIIGGGESGGAST